MARPEASGHTAKVLDADDLLRIYDDQLRGEVEMASALTWARHGPLYWAKHVGGRGFVSYRSLTGADGLEALVDATVAHYAADPMITGFEWKSRGHDPVPDLDDVLRAHQFVREEVESVMLGEAVALAVDVPLPDGVTVRRIESGDDVRRMSALHAEVFGEPDDGGEEILHRLAQKQDDVELWIAEADGEIVSAGRLEPVPGTEVAGIWGGSTLAAWRGRGIYRALTAERARSALRRGYRFLHSDSTEFSRPILERAGFLKVTTTTPYEWHRARES